MSPIYASTACLSGTEPLWDRIARYMDVGFSQIELGAGVSVTPEDLEALPGFEGALLIHNYFPPPEDPFVLNLASADAGIRQRSATLVRRALDLCAVVCAPFYSLHGGFITDPTGFGTHSFIFPRPESPAEKDAALARFVTEIEAILAYARPLGVAVLVENNVCDQNLVERLLFVEANDFLTLKQALPDNYLGILLDTGHLNVSAHTLGFDRLDFIDQVSPFVRALHVHDNDGSADQHRPLQSGSWILDVLRRPIFTDLPLVLESKFASVENLAEQIAWLHGLLKIV
ncbi:MAG TPA: hypothetical protein DEH22_05180 [Chloroflexi bacterium]|nr:hypothetical protein [Chloroflexota bacterium]